VSLRVPRHCADAARSAVSHRATATVNAPSRARFVGASPSWPPLANRVRHRIRSIGGVLRGRLAFAVLACTYLGTLLICRMSNLIPRERWTPTRRIAMTATFFNSQWFVSHVLPLTLSGVSEVVVVTDRPVVALPGVRFWCPPAWTQRVMGRAISKGSALLACGLSLKPDVFVGFHLFPGAVSALIVARLFGRPACYEMTGGPTEVVGGGVYAENALLTMLGRPSVLIEKLALAVVRQFDLVVVRGTKAQKFLTHRGVRPVTAITGSVACPTEPEPSARTYDLVFVGRLAPIKQPMQFIDIVADVRRTLPATRVAVVGDGPLLEPARAHAAALGLDKAIDFLGSIHDAHRVLIRSKLFVLTSRSEGLSIAMAEAMAAGVVPIVADVGDLGDLVINGVTGFLVTPDDVTEFARRAVMLLQDERMWARQSQAAAAAALRHSSVEAVTAKWIRSFSRLVPDLTNPSTATAGGDTRG